VEQAVGQDGVGQGAQGDLVELVAGLLGVGVDQARVDLAEKRRVIGRGGVGEVGGRGCLAHRPQQGLEPAA
jgi:hypothetical protein